MDARVIPDQVEDRRPRMTAEIVTRGCEAWLMAITK
jgi:hypothetical protein